VRWLFQRLGLVPANSTALRRVPGAAVGYARVDPLLEIRQAEILENVTYYYREKNKEDPTLVDAFSHQLTYAIVSTPDCDLLQDFKARRSGSDGTLFSILFFGAELPDRAKQRAGFGTKEWKFVRQNRMDQFHSLDGDGMSLNNKTELSQGLIVDFKRYFTLTPQELYRQFTNSDPALRCNRICRLGD